MIQDPNDPAHFSYNVERLNTYYSPDDTQTALHTLDALCVTEDPLSFSQLSNLVRYKNVDLVDETFRQVLTVLTKDHYLQRDDQGRYSFRYMLIQQWWRYARS